MRTARTEISSDWQQVAVFGDPLSAEVVAGLLRSESVPVDITSHEALSGLLQGTCIRVPPYLMHRVRWLLEQPRFADEELAYLATGQLGD